MSRAHVQPRTGGYRIAAPRLGLSVVFCALALAFAAAAPLAAAASSPPPPLQSPPAGVAPAEGSNSFTPAATPQPAPSSTYPPGTGGRVYAENCSGCHGARGEGLVGPPLAAAAFPGLVAPMVVEGGISMPAFAGVLSDQEVNAVAEFVAEELSDPDARTAQVAPGGDLFRLYCSGCHSAVGSGGAMPNLNNAPNIRQFPPAEALAAMILGRGNMPSFAGNTFDVRQQASVALYVQVIDDPPSPGGNGLAYLGPVTEGAAGAVALLLLILIAVWLAWRSRTAAP